MMKIWQKLLVIAVIAGLLAACQFPMGAEGEKGPPAPVADTPPAPTPAETEVAPRSLTICLGAEPNTLYPYGGPNAAAKSVLDAIYDGPVDVIGYQQRPVILEHVPNIARGDALVETVPIQSGSLVIDAYGAVRSLETGTRVRPAGCRSDACAITYDGVSKLDMDQMVINFTMLPDLVWSDGEPLTSDDSVYAYYLARDEDTPNSKYIFDRTQVYEAVDESTVQWWGLPGFIDPTYYANFWAPMPKHLLEGFSAAEMFEVDVAARTPIGWGPYVLQEWVPGSHLTLKKNIRYYRAEENLPVFDTLIFRIAPDPDAAIADLVSGACDILDPSANLDGQLSLLLEMQAEKEVQVFTSTNNTIEWLGLGITPASYDDGYSTTPQNDRPDFFFDQRTRQAIAMCLDRQQVVDTVLYGLSTIPNTYLSPQHPLYNATVAPYPFDPATANQILEQVGWKDEDNDPTTPRQAQGVLKVPNLTPLEFTYYTSSATQRRQVSEILVQSLGQCGIGVNLVYMSYIDLYAEAGADGPLFGRNFDLAQFAMGTSSLEPPCSWYVTEEMPSASNDWIGANVTGYQNAEFDAACEWAQQHIPDDNEYREAYLLTQSIFTADLPAIPLYMRMKVAAARPDLCNFSLDPTSSSLWNIEAFDYGSTCAP